MPKFFHELANAKELYETLASEMSLDPFLAEKDYWIMHCLWGLQQNGLEFDMKGGTSLSKGWCCIDRFSEDIDIQFDSPGLNTRSDKTRHIKARQDFFNRLTKQIQIPGITAERDLSYDDNAARGCGIRLIYQSHFVPVAELSPGVLLEVGFDRTTPNELKNFTSWVLEKAMKAGLDILDNRAFEVKCFNPEYTLIDKIQTITTKFRHYVDRKDPIKDRPGVFLRHYYDLFKLLELDRVKAFIGTDEYNSYKNEKLSASDLPIFNSRDPFKLEDSEVYKEFEKGYENVKRVLWGNIPTFEQIIDRIRSFSDRF